ncbi:hypothetical protein NL676_033185 [Syzygium grande]|nr:hypothetical protein NL676_033185 [Syzygium grande]
MKVLIVLDDVEARSHLHDIVGEKLDWFGYGSRIIITTSIISVLPEFISRGLAHVYGINMMNNDQALELFSKQALRRNLQFLILMKLRKNPHFPPSDGVDVLHVRSLVTIGKNNELGMHRLLREFGQQIIRKEDHLDPGRRGRLCNLELARNTQNMEGTDHLNFVAEDFKSMPNIRFLILDCATVGGDFANEFEGVIPTAIKSLDRLRILRLGHSSISGLPEEVTSLSCLQTLDLLRCNKLQALPELPSSLTCPHVSSDRMKALPDLKNLVKLEEICLGDKDPKELISGAVTDLCVNEVEREELEGALEAPQSCIRELRANKIGVREGEAKLGRGRIGVDRRAEAKGMVCSSSRADLQADRMWECTTSAAIANFAPPLSGAPPISVIAEVLRRLNIARPALRANPKLHFLRLNPSDRH